MKNLYLLRHAKSSWNHPELDDFERPLNQRGRRDIPVMAGIVRKQKIIPDLILSSPASRAAFTARTMAQILRFPEDSLQYNNLIYDASASALVNIVRKIDSNIDNLLLVGHNPGLTLLSNFLADKKVENIPTCGFYGMELDILKWQDIAENCGRFLMFEYPKKYL